MVEPVTPTQAAGQNAVGPLLAAISELVHATGVSLLKRHEGRWLPLASSGTLVDFAVARLDEPEMAERIRRCPFTADERLEGMLLLDGEHLPPPGDRSIGLASDLAAAALRERWLDDSGSRGEATTSRVNQQPEIYARAFQALALLAAEIGGDFSPHGIARLAAASARELLRGDSATIRVWDAVSGSLTCLVDLHDTPQPVRPPVQSGEGVLGLVFERGEPIVLEDYQHCEYKLTGYDLASALAVPLKIADRSLGVLGVGCNNQRRFSSEEVALLTVFGTQVAFALEAARLYGEAEETGRQLRALTENVTDFITVLDERGAILYASPSAERILGYAPADRVGKSVFEHVHPEDLPKLQQALEEALHTPGISGPVEFRVRHRNGFWRHLETFGMNLLDDPAMRGVVITSRDVTQRKHWEAALEESEDRYRDLVEHSQDLISTHDLQGNLLSVNVPPAKALGYSPGELLKMNLRDILAPEVQHLFEGYLVQIQRDRKASGHMWVITRSGEKRLWEYSNTLRTEGVPQPIVRSMAHDVTERWRAETALRLSEARFRAVIENISDIVTILDADGVTRYVSPSAERILGYPPTEVIGRRPIDSVHRDDHWQAAAAFGGALSEPGVTETVEYRIRHQDGSWRILESAVSNLLRDPAVGGLLITSRDITARKQAEDERRAGEARYRAIVDTASEGIITLDPGARITYANRRFCEMLGCEVDEVAGQAIFDFIDESQRAETIEGFSRRSSSREDPDVLFKRKDGSTIWVLWAASYHFSEQGEFLGATGVLLDISERKRAEEQLRLLETALANTTEGVMISTHGPDARMVYVNDGLCRMLGYEPEELIGQSPTMLQPSGPERAEHKRLIAQITQGRPFHGEISTGRKDGSEYLAELHMEPITVGNQLMYWVTTQRDVSRRRHAENELRQSRQMVRIAEERLRREIAELLHSTVQSKLVVAGHRLAQCSELIETDRAGAKQLLETVREELDGIREREVRQASHLLHPSIINVGLIPAVRSLISRFESHFGIRVEVDPRVRKLDDLVENRIPEPVRLAAYRAIEEALGNVQRHAGASMVTVSLSIDSDEMLLVTVTDNGRGVDPSRMTRGLGLSSIAGRVSEFGGSWDISGLDEGGTQLVVHLPLDSPAEAPVTR